MNSESAVCKWYKGLAAMHYALKDNICAKGDSTAHAQDETEVDTLPPDTKLSLDMAIDSIHEQFFSM